METQGKYYHEDAIKHVVKIMMANELDGVTRHCGNPVDRKYIDGFAERLIAYLEEGCKQTFE